MKLKIAIIGTNGLPGRYGGWDQLLNHLTDDLKDQFSFSVYTSSYNAIKGLKKYNDAKLIIIPLKANGVQSILYDMVSMLHAVICYDILLVLGTSGCIFLPFIKLFKKKIILNPDGQEWKRGKWNNFAQWFLSVSEKFGIKYSNVVIADNKKIQDYITKLYHRESVLIEYGGDNASFVSLSPDTLLKYSILPNTYAFKVCRIEPENNINLILEAFKNCKMTFILVGNWNFSNYGRKLRSEYANYKNLILLDPIYDQKSLDELRGNCKIYVHGHSVGGTNPSLVEAMNLGLCCVVYNVEYNLETTENCAIYFNSTNDLITILDDIDNNKIDIEYYKTKMKEIGKRRYIWDRIINEYEKLF